MSKLLVKARPGKEITAVTPASAGWNYVGFAAYRLQPGETVSFEDPARDCADHPRVINDQTGSHGLARDGSERAPTRRTLLTIERIATICFTTPFGRQFRKGPLSPFQAFGLLPSVCARL